MDTNTSVENRSRKGNVVLWTAFLLIMLTLPFVTSGYVSFQLTMAMVYAIGIFGLVILTGFSGQFSLGHVAFFAIGAYTTAILVDAEIMSYWMTLVPSALICFAFGFLFGFPALRLEGIYLALATFALSVATPQVLKLTPLNPYTGGVNGIALMKPSAPFGLPINDDQWLYLFVFAVLLVTWGLATLLIRSRSGRALMAIRDNQIAAKAMGVNVSLYKTLAFGISSAYAGIAGSLSAIVVQYVSPDSFVMTVSIAFFVGMVLGGVNWLPGALFGGAFVVFTPVLSEAYVRGTEGIVYGIILIVLVFLMPSGLVGMLRWIRRAFLDQARKT